MKIPSAPSQVGPPIASSSSSTLVSSAEFHRETSLALNDNGSCGPEQPGAHELASVPGLHRSVLIMRMRKRQTFEERGRPGRKHHMRVDAWRRGT